MVHPLGRCVNPAFNLHRVQGAFAGVGLAYAFDRADQLVRKMAKGRKELVGGFPAQQSQLRREKQDGVLMRPS